MYWMLEWNMRTMISCRFCYPAFIKNMTACPMCFGTWFGFFAGIFLYSPVHEMLEISKYVSWFFDGMLASGSVWAINAIVEWFEENRPSNRK